MLQDVSDVASREYALEKQLDKMQAEWNVLKFEVLNWKDTGGPHCFFFGQNKLKCGPPSVCSGKTWG